MNMIPFSFIYIQHFNNSNFHQLIYNTVDPELGLCSLSGAWIIDPMSRNLSGNYFVFSHPIPPETKKNRKNLTQTKND